VSADRKTARAALDPGNTGFGTKDCQACGGEYCAPPERSREWLEDASEAAELEVGASRELVGAIKMLRDALRDYPNDLGFITGAAKRLLAVADLAAPVAAAAGPVAWLTGIWMQEVGGSEGYWMEEVLPHEVVGDGFRNARPLYLRPEADPQPVAWMLPMTIRNGAPGHVPEFATERGYVERHRQREDWIPLIPFRAQELRAALAKVSP
jgi:hypothetical protein